MLAYALGSQRFPRKTVHFGRYDKKSDAHEDTIFIRELPVAAGWVGCAIWDAAVIMSRFLRTQGPVLHGLRVLELGSGVGLVGLVASRLCREAVLTDYSTSILENLEYNIWLNSADLSPERLADILPESAAAQEAYRAAGSNMARAARVAYLNWLAPECAQKPPGELEPDGAPKLPPYGFRYSVPGGTRLLADGGFPLILGSELTYQLPGVEELAGIVERFLAPGGVFWEVLSIYRGPGPRRFMCLMQARGWVVEAREPEAEYLASTGSRQSRNRQEQYLFWTLFRRSDASTRPDSAFPRLGSGALVDWEAAAITADHQE